MQKSAGEGPAEGNCFFYLKIWSEAHVFFFYCITIHLWVNNVDEQQSITLFMISSHNSPKSLFFLTALQALTELSMKTLVPPNQWLKRRGGADGESKHICGDLKVFSVSNARKITCRQVTPATLLVPLHFQTELAAGAYKIDSPANYSNRYVLYALTALRW